MKIITLCGSLKFQKEMMTIAEKMALEGNCILTPVYPISENLEKTEKQLGKLKEANFKRIELSNSIRVKNNLETIEVSIPTSKFYIRAEESNEDLYASIDLVVDKLLKSVIVEIIEGDSVLVV